MKRKYVRRKPLKSKSQASDSDEFRGGGSNEESKEQLIDTSTIVHQSPMKSMSVNTRFGLLQLQSPESKLHRMDLTPIAEETSQLKNTTSMK